MYGGPAAIRTQDLTVISRALHQAKLRAQCERLDLPLCKKSLRILLKRDKVVVGPLRFERRTSRLSAVRSTRLSYGPNMKGFFLIIAIERLYSGKHPNPTTLLIRGLLLIPFASISGHAQVHKIIYPYAAPLADSFIYDTVI